MITTIIFDFSRVLLFPKDEEYTGKLNPLHAKLSKSPSYKFLDHFELNEQLLSFLQEIKEKYALYIFTSGTIQNAPEIKKRIHPIFRKIYSAQDIGFNKRELQAYLFIVNDLSKKPEELLLVDDTIENIQAAQEAKLNTLHFKSNEQFFAEVRKLLPGAKDIN